MEIIGKFYCEKFSVLDDNVMTHRRLRFGPIYYSGRTPVLESTIRNLIEKSILSNSSRYLKVDVSIFSLQSSHFVIGNEAKLKLLSFFVIVIIENAAENFKCSRLTILKPRGS